MKLLPALLGLSVCATALGGIEWEHTDIAVIAKPGQDHADAVFHFKNTGTKPVTIKDAQPTCECLAVNAELRSYAPDENGEVSASFYVEQHNGENRKSIEVVTDDPAQPQQTLFFTVFVGETLVLTPSELKWRVGSEADSQSIHVVVTREKPMRIASVTCADARWKTSVREVKEGREYFVNVTPPQTGKRDAAKLTIKTDATEDAAKIFTAVLRVE
jgi:archaellum component FlaG (FlaF/FlaG flagellin family)